jgi:hypothetical protein
MPDPFADYVEGAAPEPEEEIPVQEPRVVESPLAPLPAISTQPAVAAIVRAETEFRLLLNEAKAITTITDEAGKITAANVGLRLKKFGKHLNRLEEHYKRPLLNAVAEIRSCANQFSSPAEVEEKRLGRVIKVYDAQVLETERRAREAALKKEQEELQARQKAEAEAAAKQGVVYTPVEAPPVVVAPVPQKTRVAEGTVSQKKEINIEVLNLDLVESKYLIRTLDEKKVKEDFKAGIRDFPGLKVTEDFETKFRV